MSRKDIIDLAKKAGVKIPPGLEEREAIYYIADQKELVDFQYNEEGFSKLVQVLDESYETLEENRLNNSSVPQKNEFDSPTFPNAIEDKEGEEIIPNLSRGEEFSNAPMDEDISSSKKRVLHEEENPSEQSNVSQNKGIKKKEEKGKQEEPQDDVSSLDDKDESKLDNKKNKEDSLHNQPNTQENHTNGSGYNPNRINDMNHNSDSTQYADSNLKHQQKVDKGKKQEASSKKENKKDKAKDEKTKKTSQKNKNSVTPKSGGGKLANHLSGGESPFRFDDLKQFFISNPLLSIILVISILFIFIIIISVIEDSGSGGKTGTRCNYELKGVVETGTVSLNDVQVELINCDGTPDNYTVLGTVDFEKYVVGVALAEIGSGSPDEAIKAQIVAARNFALTRNSGMCPGSPSTCFYGYNLSTNKIRMRACEADQVYWDYTEDIYRENRGSISLYSPEVDASSGTLWQSALSQERIVQINSIAEDVRGVVLLDQDDNVLRTSYNATISKQFQSEASAGKSYKEILSNQYGSDNFNTSFCSSYGMIDYGDYVLDSTGQDILHQDLASFLQSKGTSLEEFNQLIADNVKDAGYGTRAGVVVSAVTLIGELGNQYGVKLPYFWGGGHAGAIQDYANGNWGSNTCHTYANNQSYNYCGLDCSGFVPWAIRNGGYNINYALLAGAFYKSFPGAEKVSLKATLAVLEPGDLIESQGHITLVVDVDEASRQYIVAHASGNQSGILFSRFSFDQTGYWGVKMDGYYNNPANIRS